MMDAFEKPGRTLLTWGLLLTVGFVMVTGLNVRLHGQVSALREKSPWTYVKRAEALRKHDVPGALAMLRQAAALDEKNVEVFEQIGLIHYEQDQYTEALEAYRKAVTLGSVKPDTRGKILWCLIHLGRFLEAGQFGEDTMKLGLATRDFPRDTGDAYLRLAKRQGNAPEAKAPLEKAVSHLEEALRRAPRELRVMEKLLAAYERLGDQAKVDAMRLRITRTEGA